MVSRALACRAANQPLLLLSPPPKVPACTGTVTPAVVPQRELAWFRVQCDVRTQWVAWRPRQDPPAPGVQLDGTPIGLPMKDPGRPTWYVSSGTMQRLDRYEGTRVEYGDGGLFEGRWVPPLRRNRNIGCIALEFCSATAARLTLSNGEILPLTRFPF